MTARPVASLTRRLLALALAVVVLPALGSAPAGAAGPVRRVADVASPFTRLPEFALTLSPRTRVAPTHYAAYRLDLRTLRQTLSRTPGILTVPDPAGRPVRFRVAEDSILQPGLQARHPGIHTYAGRGIDDPTRTIRLDLTPMGFHASVRSPGAGRAWYVDPAYNRRGATTLLSYFGAAVARPDAPFAEGELADSVEAASSAAAAAATAPNAEVQRRTYRLAFVTDPSYAAYFGTANVLAEKVTLINRVDQIYNDDLAIRLELIDGTDTLNLDTQAKAVGVDGPCGAHACFTPAQLASCGGGTLTRNEWVLGQLVGADTYDIGHIGLGVNGGGIAGLGVVGTSSKADGCTGLPFPKGDFYAIDYVAHEMGHQFGGNHTFNGTENNCSLTNRNGDTSVEPGSGSSVMAYAGICDQDDLQPHTDPYFSQRSIDEITTDVTAAPGTVDEVQTITLAGFDTDGDSVTLTYPGHDPVVITRGSNYTNLQVTAKMATLTGKQPRVAGYDGGVALNDGGFQLTFGPGSSAVGTDVPRIGIGATTGGVTAYVGVQQQGGPETNQGTANASGNHAPAVTAPADKTIPIRTPFTLTGSGTDSDGNPLTYLWEQNDTGGTSPTAGTGLVDNTKRDGPLFRVFGTSAQVSLDDSLQSPSPGENLAGADPSRTFPDLAQILAGTTNAKTGSCPAAPADTTKPVPAAVVDCFSEFLPTADYGTALSSKLDFRLTARDGFGAGGGTAYDDVVVSVDHNAGPFLVTSRATPGATGAAGAIETVTWAVNGTAAVGLAPNVMISLSADGGQSFPYVLAASTPNDGSADVPLPGVTTDHARIKVSAVGNYFFDLNDADFSIASSLSVSQPGNRSVQYSDPFAAPLTVTASSDNVDGDQLNANVAGVAGLVVTRSSPSDPGTRPGTATFTVSGPVTDAVGAHTVTLQVSEPSGGASATRTFTVTVVAEDATVTYDGQTDAVTEGGTSASVLFSATVVDAVDPDAGQITNATVRFVNRGTGDTLCAAPVTGGPTTGTASCSAPLTRSGATTAYTVGTVVGGRYLRDDAADDVTVTVHRDSTDTTPPQTSITRGPGEGSFVLAARPTLRYAATEEGSTFRCFLDDVKVPCRDDRVRLPRLKLGTHLFTVAAVDSNGNLDPTPATRAFATPLAAGALERVTRDWHQRRSGGAYRGSYLTASAKGATLRAQVSNVDRVALVVGTGPGYGKVAVFLDGLRIGKVDLASGRRHGAVLVSVKTFRHARSGRLTIRSLGRRPIRIEGLGLFSSP